MKVYVTNNLELFKKKSNKENFLICTNKNEFNSFGFNADIVEEYIYTNIDKPCDIVIPDKIFKLVKTIKQNNLVVNTYKVDKKILNGKAVASSILTNIKKELTNYSLNNNQLVIVQVGDNAASKIYINNKLKIADSLNIKTKYLKLNDNITENDLIEQINKLNNDNNVSAILVQLPLPNHLDENKITSTIDKRKDIDCLHPYNIGRVLQSKSDNLLFPCTPIGCVRLLQEYNINLDGKHIVIVGRSNIVGKPLMAICLNKNATVSICHSKTKNLSSITKQADILIAAIGKPNFFDSSYIKKGCICIDVGINRTNNGICGDINFDSVYSKVKYISPVPYGVGPMTLSMLFLNFLTLVKEKNN